MGDRPINYSLPVVAVANAAEAIRVMDRGEIALLPHEAWDQAERVLRHYGCDGAAITWQLGLARGVGADERPTDRHHIVTSEERVGECQRVLLVDRLPESALVNPAYGRELGR